MSSNTGIWLKRSKRRFATSQEAWEDIERSTGHKRDGIVVAHTRYYWRWKIRQYKPKGRRS